MDRQPIVLGVNRLIVRTDSPDSLFNFLCRQLLLPEAWPITTNPIYTSGGIHLGNMDLEIMQMERKNMLGRRTGPKSTPSKARLFGITFALAPYETSLAELDERGIPHTPPMPFFQVDDQGWQITTWTSVFLGGLLGDSPAQRLFFAYSQRLDKETWEHGSLPASRNHRFGLPYVLNTLYRRGATFSIDYNPVWRAAHHKAEPMPAGLDVVGVYEVTVGARDLDRARACWKALLDPYPEIADNVWELPNNLHLHLVSKPRDGLVGMIWQVASLNRAAQFFHRRALQVKENSAGIHLNIGDLQGISIRLIQ